MKKEPRTIITLEALLRRVGPKRLLWSLAGLCDQIAREDRDARWPAWLQSADLLIETAALLPDTNGDGFGWTALQ